MLNVTYTVTLIEADDGTVHVLCPEAAIDQEFLAEDLPALLVELPTLAYDNRAD